MAAVIGISTGSPFGNDRKGNVVYASNQLMNVGELDNNSTAIHQDKYGKFKADFAYEMEQITAIIMNAPSTNIEDFKIELAHETAKVTAKVMTIIPSLQRNDFADGMAQITTKIVSDQNLNIEKGKAEFAYEIAQLTTKILTNGDKAATGADPKATLLRNNTDIELKSAVKVDNTDSGQKAIVNPGDISPEIYTGLIDELMHVGDRRNHFDNKINIDGEIRYHYAFNSGSKRWERDSSGIRIYLDFDTAINQDWRVYGMLDGEKSLVNYNDKFKLSRLYVAGKSGSSKVKAGSFGYLMADGNIYDSGFKGVRSDFGEPVKYTVSYGETNYTKETYIATARYNDFNYNLEAGVYHYQIDDVGYKQNTIRTLGGNYNFSNFGVGAMVLDSSLADTKGNSKGYVLSLNYGDLKTWRRGTYGIFAKYYDQPKYTYISHGMNGRGSIMNGFKGYGLGINYTFKENVVAGIEYYGLRDKITKESGDTWWSQITLYF